MVYHRTLASVLTLCLTEGAHPKKSLDYGELRSNAGEKAVEHLLCGAAVAQLGANLNQGLPSCQGRFLRKVGDARQNG